MKSSLLFTVSLCISVLGYDLNLDTDNVCKYTMCKINNDSAFHKHNATVFAKSKFDSLIILFRSRVHDKDTSLKNINKLSGGLFGNATNYMTYPIVQRMNKIIEDYCIKNAIAIFITYPPYGIHYANGETNDFPDPADSMYINRLVKCSIPDVTDTLIQLFNKDPEISTIQKAIDKEYKRYKNKMDSLLKINN
jgi:hypothetical protein